MTKIGLGWLWCYSWIKGRCGSCHLRPPFLERGMSDERYVSLAMIYPKSMIENHLTAKPAAMTVRWLSRSWGTPSTSKLILCTGERMETLITKLYRPQGISTTTFEPVHSKGLSNEFFCYANFECSSWKRKADRVWFSGCVFIYSFIWVLEIGDLYVSDMHWIWASMLEAYGLGIWFGLVLVYCIVQTWEPDVNA